MSVQEIEQAIKELSQDEIEHLSAWLTRYCAQTGQGREPIRTKPHSLADAMGSLIGSIGQDNIDSPTSSRDAGQVFAKYVAEKKREHRL